MVVRYRQIDPSELTLVQRLTEWVVHPKSRRYELWRIMILLSIYATVILEPWTAAFQRGVAHIRLGPLDVTSWLYLTDVLYLFDMIVHFHLPYVEEHQYVMDTRKIGWHYLEHNFWLDLAALVPIEVISPWFPAQDVAFWVLRINRLVRGSCSVRVDSNP